MKRRVIWLAVLAFVFGPVGAVLANAAVAAPHVVLALKQAQVMTHDGKMSLEAVPAKGAKRGALLRYTIVATNTGAKPAFDLAPVAKVPASTTFVAGSATPQMAVEYSLDGHSYSAKPMIKIKAADGKVKLVPANPSAYVALHWHDAHPLNPHATQTFSYEVRIK